MFIEAKADTPTETYGEVHHDDGHGKDYGSTPFFLDTATWVLIPFLIVVLLFWKMGVHKTIGGALDKRGKDISDDLDQARTIAEEAQELLAKYQRRQREAEDEAQAIIDQAKRDAKRMSEDMRAKLEEQLERRAKAAEDKIARAEAQAIAEVRNNTADLAVKAAEELVKTRVEGPSHNALIDKAINDVRERLN